ncbi:MAG TPA: glycoside hydrolase N-terminal domain-containing protein, partial [Puia sp.]|nr:glycoside hydrolase N-terminal domain-containing protein [Puia sp.]
MIKIRWAGSGRIRSAGSARMRLGQCLVFGCLLSGACSLPARSQYNEQRLGISYSYPADFRDWANAFLAGNGKMGIMVFGNPLNETVIYNDRRFNLAGTSDRSFAGVSAADVEKIKNDCADGNFAAANQLAVSSAHYKGGGEGNRHPGFEMSIAIPEAGAVTHYSRTCNFRTGEIVVRWTDDRGDWERKSFVSRQDNVIVQYLTAPGRGKISCTIKLGTDTGMNFPKGMNFINKAKGGWLNIRAHYPPNTGSGGYEGVTRVVADGGTQTVSGDVLMISGARSVIL